VSSIVVSFSTSLVFVFDIVLVYAGTKWEASGRSRFRLTIQDFGGVKDFGGVTLMTQVARDLCGVTRFLTFHDITTVNAPIPCKELEYFKYVMLRHHSKVFL
jgi:hypothetical protein